MSTAKAGLEPIAAAEPAFRARAADYLELTKPRITLLVLLTMMVGFYLAAPAAFPKLLLCHALAGTALVCSGASAWNMWLERQSDARMLRTAGRPLPSMRLLPSHGLAFALVLSITGLAYLTAFVNALSALLAAVTLASYLFLYTPLKARTWLCTTVGAVPGAIPPLIGWSAASGELAIEAWSLFAILFLWQLPHFYAIAWMYRDDYARAGLPMLPVVDPGGGRTSRHVSLSIAALTAASALPFGAGLAGVLYLAGGLLLGAAFLGYGVKFGRSRSVTAARRLFLVSVCYLPALLALLVLDHRRP